MSVERNYLSKAEHDNYPTSGLGEKMWVAKDIEDLNQTICLIEAAEGYEAKRTREDYDGARSSNDKPHPKGLQDGQNGPILQFFEIFSKKILFRK